MHIVFFIGNMVAGGGGEKVLSMLANYYCEKGNDVDIALLLRNKVDRSHFGLNGKITIIDLSPKRSGSYWKNVIPWLLRIRKYVKETNPDAIVSFFGRINALVLTALRGLKFPIVISERNDPKNDRRGKIMYYYCRWIYKYASAIIFQTSYQQNCFPLNCRKNSYIIPNPLVILPQSNEPETKGLIVTVGRLNSQKNHKMLIDAISIVQKRYPSIQCNIYGEGELRVELQNIIDSKKLSDVVHLEGKKSNVLDYVSKASVFVMSSDREGLSNALMEAMMLGKVCISTDYPGVEDIIEEEKTGYIVPRRNAELMANKILEVLSDSAKKNSAIKDNSRAKMLGYDTVNILDKWNKVLNDLIENKV